MLEKWASNPKLELSSTGKDWLIAALDPFHDTVLQNLAGWPDVESNYSVVRCVTQNLSVSKPSGMAAGNWDCHIAVLPWLDPQSFVGTTSMREGNIGSFSAASNLGKLGGVTIAPVPANVPANWLPIIGTGNNQTITIPDKYQQGIGRLIGMGYEVYDTTAELYKQGSLTCYRQNEAPRDAVFYSLNEDSPVEFGAYPMTGSPIRMPPTSLSQINLMPGNRTWEMKQGLYQTVAFHSNENTAYAADYNQPVLYPCGNDDEIGGGPGVNGGIIYVPKPLDSNAKAIGTVTLKTYGSSGQHLHPIHQSGCVLSGLNEQSSFTVTVKFYYESFPSIEESSILVLATPSAKYDPMALEIYSRAIQNMPCGVPVAENGLGDWFYGIVEEIGKFVSPIVAGAQKAVKVHKALNVQNNQASQVLIAKPKKKKLKQNNATLQAGSRGPKGKVQGPMRK